MLRPGCDEVAKLLSLRISDDSLPKNCPAHAHTNLISRMGMTGRTVLAPKSGRRGFLDAEESQKIYRISRIWLMALKVFQHQDRARRFLTDPHALIGGKVPLDVVANDELGCELVEQLLGRLYFGSAA